jgi:hypothetical protein
MVIDSAPCFDTITNHAACPNTIANDAVCSYTLIAIAACCHTVAAVAKCSNTSFDIAACFYPAIACSVSIAPVPTYFDTSTSSPTCSNMRNRVTAGSIVASGAAGCYNRFANIAAYYNMAAEFADC